MNHAKCIVDGRIYSAFEFSGLFSTDLEQKRRLLQCPECGGPAFFRNTSSNNRAPCFGARPHASGCSLSAYDQTRLQTLTNEDAQLLNSGGKIVVDLSYGASISPERVTVIEGTNASADFGACRPDARMHRRPSSLLRLLVESPSFRNSDQPLEVSGLGCKSVREFFVPLLDVSTSHVGLFRGFWGFLSGVTLKDDTIWFNSGGLDTVSFCLDSRHLNDFHERYRVGCAEDLAGVHILVMGTLRVSQQGKLFCVIEALERMALYSI